MNSTASRPDPDPEAQPTPPPHDSGGKGDLLPQNPSQPAEMHPTREVSPVGAGAVHWTERPAVRAATFFLIAALSLCLVLLVWQRLAGRASAGAGAASALPAWVQDGGDGSSVAVVPLATPLSGAGGISRLVEFDTVIPSRPRDEVITYTVRTGDYLFSIADKYGLKPETILWGNYDTLKDNPEFLSPDQVLNILPVDGSYHQWQEGDTLQSVADFFKADPQAILSYPGNPLDLTQPDNNYGLQPGMWVIIPGGQRPFKDWGPPAISRTNPASAQYYGEGHCGSVYEGPIGTATFIWPTTERRISGYHYSTIHRGIDIGGAMGNAIYAADSGVVVYAGWSNYGYGNLIVIDHGNGWQTAYAHLSVIGVACGQGVGQGTTIGAMGSTGNSTGPHLHFEMVYNGTKPNPMDFLY